DLPSRVADDLFWLGRYLHRADNDVRIARYLFTKVTDHRRGDRPGAIDVLADELLRRDESNPAEAAVHSLVARVFHRDAGGPRSAIAKVDGLIRSLRDRVSTDAWRIIQGIE